MAFRNYRSNAGHPAVALLSHILATCDLRRPGRAEVGVWSATWQPDHRNAVTTVVVTAPVALDRAQIVETIQGLVSDAHVKVLRTIQKRTITQFQIRIPLNPEEGEAWQDQDERGELRLVSAFIPNFMAVAA